MPPTPRRRLGEMFAKYATDVVPATAGHSQEMTSRVAFYAGAHAVFQILTGMASSGAAGDDVTPADVQALVDLDLELREHIGMVTGQAPPSRVTTKGGG